MYSVGVIAQMIDVQPHTVRFWTDEFDIKPQIGKGGRRYYSELDIKTFEKIKHLLYKKRMRISSAKEKLDGQIVQNISSKEEKKLGVSSEKDLSHTVQNLLQIKNMLQNVLLKIS